MPPSRGRCAAQTKFARALCSRRETACPVRAVDAARSGGVRCARRCVLHGNRAAPQQDFSASRQKNSPSSAGEVNPSTNQLLLLESTHDRRNRRSIELHAVAHLVLTHGVFGLSNELTQCVQHDPLGQCEPRLRQCGFGPPPPAHRQNPFSLSRFGCREPLRHRRPQFPHHDLQASFSRSETRHSQLFNSAAQKRNSRGRV
jgi:hypothetical protein